MQICNLTDCHFPVPQFFDTKIVNDIDHNHIPWYSHSTTMVHVQKHMVPCHTIFMYHNILIMELLL